jgi:hypothetical protein
MFGVDYSQVTGERIISAECLFLGAQVTVYFLFARIVDGILVSREVVRS